MIAIYARVSTEDQVKNGFSLQDQLRDCKKKAQTNDVVEYVDEGVSGEYLDRPELSRMRSDIRNGLIHRVVCLDPDRLSRKLMNQLILSDEIENRAELVFVNGEYARTPEGQLFYQMRGAISQFEKAKINERMSRGRREKARQGRVLRDFHIYGYDFDPETEQFLIHEREVIVVKLIFELFTNPKGRVQGINGIATYLNNLGIVSKRGSIFHRQVIRQMLMNKAYIGEFYQNKWNTEGMLGNRYKNPEDRIRQKTRPKDEWIRLPIPSIVDVDQFYYAQTLLEQSRRRWAGKSKRTYLLSGLLRCGACGNTMVGRKKKNWGKEEYFYSDVKNTAGAKNSGCGTSVRCDDIESNVWCTILSWVGEPTDEKSSLDIPEQEMPYENTELIRIEKELEKNKFAIERLFNLLSDPDVGEQDIREKLKDLQHAKQQLLSRHEGLQQKLADLQKVDKRYYLATLKETWKAFLATPEDRVTFEAKKALLRTVIREVRVRDKGASIEIVTL